MISTTVCPWCVKVKKLLETKGHTYTEIDASEVMSFLQASGIRTVPQVYLDGNRIGGFEAVETLLNG